MTTRLFRALTWLNAEHSPFVRRTAAMTARAAVWAITRNGTLASEAAGLWEADRFALALHRLNWYRRHARPSASQQDTAGASPLFDPTTGMGAQSVTALDAWLNSSPARNVGLRDQLARLYVLARKVQTATDAIPQRQLMADYTRLANTLCPALPAFDPAPARGKATDPYFTLDDALAALGTLDGTLKMPWYIISGTFLGAVREGTFLSHDYDIDIGINAEDFSESALLEAILQASDLTLVNISPHLHLTEHNGVLTDHARPALYHILHISGIGIDVFIHHLDGDLRWHGSAEHRWDNHDFALIDYTISGLPVRGPALADRYLTENYGDWRTPVKTFNCSTGTPNVRFNHSLSAVTETLRVAVLSQDMNAAMTAQLVLRQEGYLPQSGDFIIPWALTD